MDKKVILRVMKYFWEAIIRQYQMSFSAELGNGEMSQNSNARNWSSISLMLFETRWKKKYRDHEKRNY